MTYNKMVRANYSFVDLTALTGHRGGGVLTSSIFTFVKKKKKALTRLIGDFETIGS